MIEDTEELRIRDDPILGIVLENLTEIHINTIDKALFYLAKVQEKRISGNVYKIFCAYLFNPTPRRFLVNRCIRRL